MLRIVFISAAAIALTFTAMASVKAGGPHGISYEDKKQGQVHFERSDTSRQAIDDKSVEDIEPAAGVQDEASKTGKGDHGRNRLSEEIKLPRKK